MVRVSTFCPRCGESIETEIPEEARNSGRAELACPSCRFEFVIAPAAGTKAAPPAPRAAPEEGAGPGPAAPLHAPPRPSTGEGDPQSVPPGPGRRRTPSFKPVAAGLLLIFVAVLGLWGGFSIFADDIVATSLEVGDATDFSGRVVDERDDPLEGVRVEMVEAPGNQSLAATRTDADGTYRFEGIEPGVYTFRLSLENHTTVLLEVPVFSEEYARLFGQNAPFGQVTMRAGDPDEVRESSQVDSLDRIARVWGGFIIFASALTLVGGWSSLRRRGLPLAIVGAVAGIFAGLMFLIGSLLSILALILIIVARKEFGPLVRRSKD